MLRSMRSLHFRSETEADRGQRTFNPLELARQGLLAQPAPRGAQCPPHGAAPPPPLPSPGLLPGRVVWNARVDPRPSCNAALAR